METDVSGLSLGLPAKLNIISLWKLNVSAACQVKLSYAGYKAASI